MINECLSILRASLERCFDQRCPSIRATWPLSGRAVSEIGGRLVESFVLARLPHELSLAMFDGEIVCNIPESGRAMEDIAVTFVGPAGQVRLLVDVKGHNEYRSGSRPNLASIRKCLELYGNPVHVADELTIALIGHGNRMSGRLKNLEQPHQHEKNNQPDGEVAEVCVH